MKTRHQRGGYVLLVVLAASVLVVTVLGTLAKISLRRAVDANDAERSLRQRWGALTLQQALLQAAPKIFDAREKELAKVVTNQIPLPVIRQAITVGDVTFDMLLGDEDAKLNLNAIYHQVGEGKTQRAVGSIVGPHVNAFMRLVPAVPPQSIAREKTRLSVSAESEDSEKDPINAFDSWGQIFDVARLKAVLGSEVALPNVTTGITCWGSGQLNFRRASDEAILAVIGSVVQDGGARRILQRYRKNPTAAMQILLQLEVNNNTNRERLMRLLTESSNNFSIWITATSKTGRGLTQFTAAERDDEGVTRFNRFAF